MTRHAAFLSATVTLLTLSMPSLAAEQVDSSLQAGGLKPREFVFLNTEAGPAYLGLHTLKAGTLVDGARVKSKGLGMMYGAGLGVRLLDFTLGARFRSADFPDWQLWTLGAEAGVHIPLGRIEPYFTLGAGYASLGGIRSEVSTVGANGLDVRVSAGVDFYLSNRLSVGANLSGDMLFLGRKGDRLPRQQPTDPNRTYNDWVYGLDGFGFGIGGTVSVVLGLHF